MTKLSIDDEIDLIELIQIFWLHRIKFIVMGLLGLIVGLSFTFTHEPVFSTDFKFYLGHPYLNNKVLTQSALLHKTLNDSTLNPDILPNYSLDQKTKTYTVRSNKVEVRASVESLLIKTLTEELKQIKLVASNAQGSTSRQVLIINDENDKGLSYFNNADLANLSEQDVISGLEVSFSITKPLYPNPVKHGVIGFFIGLILGFMWMVLAILISKINLGDPSHKA